MKKFFHRLSHDHHVPMFVGSMFFLNGLVHLIEGTIRDVLGISIQTPHWLLFIGVLNIVMSLVFMLNGALVVEKSLEDGDDPQHDNANASPSANPSANLNDGKLKELEGRVAQLEKSLLRAEQQNVEAKSLLNL